MSTYDEQAAHYARHGIGPVQLDRGRYGTELHEMAERFASGKLDARAAWVRPRSYGRPAFLHELAEFYRTAHRAPPMTVTFRDEIHEWRPDTGPPVPQRWVDDVVRLTGGAR